MITAPSITLTPEACATEFCDREAMNELMGVAAEMQATMRELTGAALVAIAMHNHPGKSPEDAAKREAARIRRECAALAKFSNDVQAGIKDFREANRPKADAAVARLSGLRTQIAHQEVSRGTATSALMAKRAKLKDAGLSVEEVDRLAPIDQATALIDAEIARLQAEIEKVETFLNRGGAGPLPFQVAGDPTASLIPGATK